VCNPFWGGAISRKSIDIYRYALTGWGEEWGTIGVIWPYVNGIVYVMSVRKGGWNLENGVSSTSLRNPWVTSASRFCRAFDEVRQFFRIRTTMKQPVSLQQQRELFRQRLVALQALVQAAS
jgi:hypothetical protein